MKKFEIDHLKSRVSDTVKCTNGSISTKLEKQYSNDEISETEMAGFIRSGEATLKPSHLLHKESRFYRSTYWEILYDCFEYPLTPAQAQARADNDLIDKKIDELHTAVELAGAELIDRAILGIIKVGDFPKELHKLGEMALLANK